MTKGGKSCYHQNRFFRSSVLPFFRSSVLNKALSCRRYFSIFALFAVISLGFSACDNLVDTPELQTVATPTATPTAGTYETAQNVSLSSATTGAAIYYTLDNSTPTKDSTPYTAPINISAFKTIKAIAVKDGMNNSTVLTAAYTIGTVTPPGQVVAPTADPPGGNYTTAQSVTLTSGTEGAVIYYTLNGTAPTKDSTHYEAPIAIDKTTTLKAIAVKADMDNSTVLMAEYVLNLLDGDDAEDFGGPGGWIDQVFNVGTADEWNAACTVIRNDEPYATKNYVINITDDFSIESSTAPTFGEVWARVSIRGNHTLSLSTKGSALRNQGQTVIVRDVDFTGMTDNNAPLIYLGSGALTLRGSASVSDNTAVGRHGGGVYVSGTFTMQDSATVSDNTSSESGGGVYVSRGTFTMQDSAAVSGNSATYSGGGVYVYTDGTFTMQDSATVSGNTYSSSYIYSGGGGVYSMGTFRIAGGTVYGNTAGVDSNVAKDENGTPVNGGAALYVPFSYGKAQYGTFDGDTFTPKGNLTTTDETITVVNGVLQ